MLKDLLGPVTRVKKKKKNLVDFDNPKVDTAKVDNPKIWSGVDLVDFDESGALHRKVVGHLHRTVDVRLGGVGCRKRSVGCRERSVGCLERSLGCREGVGR